MALRRGLSGTVERRSKGAEHFVRFVAKAHDAVVDIVAIDTRVFCSEAQAGNRKLDSRQNLAKVAFLLSLYDGQGAS